MKTKIFIIAVLFIVSVNLAAAQENPVLKNTFPVSNGKLIVANVFNELKISDLSYETIKTLVNAVDALKKDLQNTEKENKKANTTISEQQKTIDKMKNDITELKRQLAQMSNDMRDLKNKIK